MTFGTGLRPADGTDAATWLTGALDLRSWTVGGLVPDRFETYVLVEAAPPETEDWWAAQRRIVVALADVVTRFTATPDAAWFAVWEGHGFAGGPTDSPAGGIEQALRAVPRFASPTRAYCLLQGAVADVEHLRWPGEPDRWFRPDLWWPEDRQWFVGTDVDFWCTYVGGSRAMTDALASRFGCGCRTVARDAPLPLED